MTFEMTVTVGMDFPSLDKYFDDMLEKMGEDAAAIVHLALPLATGVNVRIEYLDKRVGVEQTTLDFPDDGAARHAYVLIKPGHFDTLYARCHDKEGEGEARAGAEVGAVEQAAQDEMVKAAAAAKTAAACEMARKEWKEIREQHAKADAKDAFEQAAQVEAAKAAASAKNATALEKKLEEQQTAVKLYELGRRAYFAENPVVVLMGDANATVEQAARREKGGVATAAVTAVATAEIAAAEIAATTAAATAAAMAAKIAAKIAAPVEAARAQAEEARVEQRHRAITHMQRVARGRKGRRASVERKEHVDEERAQAARRAEEKARVAATAKVAQEAQVAAEKAEREAAEVMAREVEQACIAEERAAAARVVAEAQAEAARVVAAAVAEEKRDAKAARDEAKATETIKQTREASKEIAVEAGKQSDDESTFSGELGHHQEERPSTPFDDAMSMVTNSAQSYMSSVSSHGSSKHGYSSMSDDSCMFGGNSQSMAGQCGTRYVQAGGAAVCVCSGCVGGAAGCACLCVCVCGDTAYE
jgi:hypothetical protein